MSREMPNAVSLEQSVLGSLMVYPKVIQDCQELDLHAEEFYLPSHQQIYQAICTIHENGQPIDMNTVVTRLQETDQLESSQGTDYIIRLADSAISSATSRSYIETIKNKAQLRRLIYVADKISEEGYSSGEDIDTVLDDAEEYKYEWWLAGNVFSMVARIRYTVALGSCSCAAISETPIPSPLSYSSSIILKALSTIGI